MRLRKRARSTGGAIIESAAAVVVVAALILTNPVAARAATSTVTPTAITTNSGWTGSGQTVASIKVQDLSGTTDNWDKYVEFGGQYRGYLSYTVPSAVTPASITGIQVKINYRGPAATAQTWSFKLYNWSSHSWMSVGSNASAPDWGDWTLLTFNASGTLRNFVSSSNTMRLQFVANNADDAADIDYAGIVVTTGGSGGDLPAPVSCPGCWHPALQTSWNWVLSHVPTAPYRDVQMYRRI